MAIILSLDASTSSTGWAIFEGEKLTKYGVLKPKPALDWSERIKDEFNFLNEIVQVANVDKIVAESPPAKQGMLTVMQKLGAIQGMILSLGAINEIGNEFFTPTQWRSRLGNVFDGTRKGTNRAELKRKAIEIANETFNLQLKFVPNHPSQNEDDIAEAILIGWAYIHPVERKKAFIAKSKK